MKHNYEKFLQDSSHKQFDDEDGQMYLPGDSDNDKKKLTLNEIFESLPAGRAIFFTPKPAPGKCIDYLLSSQINDNKPVKIPYPSELLDSEARRNRTLFFEFHGPEIDILTQDFSWETNLIGTLAQKVAELLNRIEKLEEKNIKNGQRISILEESEQKKTLQIEILKQRIDKISSVKEEKFNALKGKLIEDDYASHLGIIAASGNNPIDIIMNNFDRYLDLKNSKN